MKRMQAPERNRKGKFEEQDVPERLVERFLAKGWKVVVEKQKDEAKKQSVQKSNTSKNKARR